MRKKTPEIFEELVLWSEKDVAFVLNDFCKMKGITIADLRIKARNNPKAFAAVGKATCNLFNNTCKARNENRISQDVYEKLLREEHNFSHIPNISHKNARM